MAELSNLRIGNGDAFLKLPNGTTAERPSSLVNGQIRVDERGVEEVYSSGWKKQPKYVEDGLQCYLDAGLSESYESNRSSPVTHRTWYDISGNGRNYVWGNNPTFFRNGNLAFFNCLGNRATGPASNSFGINNTSGYTLFHVSLTYAYSSNAVYKFYTSLGSDDASPTSTSRGIFAHPGWTVGNYYFDQGGCCDPDQRTDVPLGNIFKKWTVYCARSTIATRSIFTDGIRQAHNTTAAADVDLGADAAHLGGSDEYGGASSLWSGYLSAWMVYNRGLSDEEVIQNTNYLNRRFMT